MRLRGLFVLLLAVLALALLGGAASGRPTSAVGGAQLLRTVAPVTGLAADGSLAVVSTECLPHRFRVRVWNPKRRSTVFIGARAGRYCSEARGSGILAQGIAGGRLAWVPYEAGHNSESWLLTATIRRPRSIARLTDTVHNTDSGVGDYVGNVHGDGPLLVFNTWTKCETQPDEPTYYPCPEHIPPRTACLCDEVLWRIVGDGMQLLASSSNELAVLSVAAGRILVRRADGSLELRRANGSLLRSFPFRPGEVRAALLDASELVVLAGTAATRRTWRVYDPVSGELERDLRARGGATAADVERGLLVYVVGRVVHVLRLADGREATFRAPAVSIFGYPTVRAKLEPSGLFYAYQVRGRLKGRVRFVPFDEIRFR
jgi:hypothetical protein